MRKRRKNLFILILFLFIFMGNVYAEEDTTCNAISLNELRTAAANLKVTYVPVTVEKETRDAEGNTYMIDYEYLDIKIYNMMSKLYVKMDASSKSVSDISKLFTLDDVGSDGAITIRQVPADEVVNYKFVVYSDYYGCSSKTLRTMTVTLPRRNPYSSRAMCKDIPEFYLCQDYVTFEITAPMVDKGVSEYKAKLEAQEKDNELKTDNNGVVSKTISTISKYKFVFVGVIILIGVIITVIILKRKRSVL